MRKDPWCFCYQINCVATPSLISLKTIERSRALNSLSIYVILPISFYGVFTFSRPATHPDLIGISRFFSTNLGVSRFPDSTWENPEFLFRFEIGKTKGRLTLLHGPCLQTHKVWAKNKCYDRLNPLYTATQRVK